MKLHRHERSALRRRRGTHRRSSFAIIGFVSALALLGTAGVLLLFFYGAGVAGGSASPAAHTGQRLDLTAFLPSATQRVPAFPGAEGAGAWARGGRGGRVLEVTNLNDSGPGSFRAAVEAEGPRTVVFTVNGIIELREEIHIRNPFLTIAGHTAPGGGITLKGTDAGGGQMLTISTHDVILRHLRIRSGAHGPPGEGQVNLAIDSGAHDVIVDHVSLSWSLDENMSIFRNIPAEADPQKWPELGNITVQRSILAEGLSPHSTGLAIGGEYDREGWRGVHDVTVHHNLFVSNDHRNPAISGNRVQVLNNVVYNWGSKLGETHNASTVDWIGNYFKAGPSTAAGGALIVHNDFPAGLPFFRYGPPSLYIAGNLAVPGHPDPSADNWSLYSIHYANTMLPPHYRRNVPLTLTGIPVELESAESAFRSVLHDAGANLQPDCQGGWSIIFDSVDSRLLSNVRNGTGPRNDIPSGEDADPPPLVSHENEVGGYSFTPAVAACVDTDHDGMPDVWERATNLLKVGVDDSAGYQLDENYTNLEVYLNRPAEDWRLGP